MNDFLTTGNGEMTTSVGAGISLHRTDWDWGTYTNMMAGTVVGSSLSCPVCIRQKSKAQVVCQVCFQNILDISGKCSDILIDRSKPGFPALHEISSSVIPPG